MRLAWKRQRLLSVPNFPTVQADSPRQGFFEDSDVRRVLAHLPEYLRAPVQFPYYTGWRFCSEVLSLTWKQVDLNAGTVRLDPGTTKNNRGRESAAGPAQRKWRGLTPPHSPAPSNDGTSNIPSTHRSRTDRVAACPGCPSVRAYMIIHPRRVPRPHQPARSRLRTRRRTPRLLSPPCSAWRPRSARPGVGTR